MVSGGNAESKAKISGKLLCERGCSGNEKVVVVAATADGRGRRIRVFSHCGIKEVARL